MTYCACSCTECSYCPGADEYMTALLRRDWAVRVLLAWFSAGYGRCVELFPGGEGPFVILKHCVNPIKPEDEDECPIAADPESALHAAALVALDYLSPEVREQLGECP